MKTEDLLKEIALLPVEERALVADAVLRSLNPPDPEIDKKWGEVAKRRLADLQRGDVKAIPGVDVFREIWKRFS
ncbi:MAG: addiction module protein [Candidatus Desulforudis sp.]|nr:addiction module protein [Desulforudis sp.]